MRFTLSLIAVISVAQAEYRSGSIATYERFQYGKFVTRMRAPDVEGTVASFFTYWDGPQFFPGGWNEIKFEIAPSKEKDPLSVNVTYGDGKQPQNETSNAHGFNPRDSFHTYSLEWTPDYISFEIDGAEIRHLDRYDTEAVKFMDKAQSLRMNFWTPTGDNELSAGFDDKTMPWYVLYDYVEVYSWEEATNEFVFKWRDDFHDFNYDRWHKQEGGFEDNSSIFYPENVYTSHGKLVIKMETEEYHDKEQEQFESPEPEFTPYYYQGEYVHEHLAHGGYPDHHPDYPTNSLPQNAYPLLNLKEKSYKKKSKDEEEEDKLREKYLQKLAKLQAEEWEEYDRIHGIDPSVRKRQLEQIEHEHKMQKEMQKKLEKQQKEQGKMIEKEIKEESEEDKKERKHIKKEEKDYSKIAEEEFQDFGGMDYYPRSQPQPEQRDQPSMMKEHEAHDVLSYDEFIQMREMQRQQEKYYKKEEKYDYKEEKYDQKREEKFYKEEMESEKKKDKKDHKKKDKSSKKHKPKDKDEDKDQKEDQESDDDYWRDWDLHEHQEAKRDFHEHVPQYFAEPDFYGKPIVVPDPHHWDKDDKKKFKKMMKIDEERTPYEHKIDKKHHDDYSDDEHNVDMYHYPGGQTVVHHGESDSEDEVYCDYFGFCIHNKKDKDHHSKKHHYDDHKVDVYHYPDGQGRYVHHEDSDSEDEDRHHMVPYPYYQEQPYYHSVDPHYYGDYYPELQHDPRVQEHPYHGLLTEQQGKPQTTQQPEQPKQPQKQEQPVKQEPQQTQQKQVKPEEPLTTQPPQPVKSVESKRDSILSYAHDHQFENYRRGFKESAYEKYGKFPHHYGYFFDHPQYNEIQYEANLKQPANQQQKKKPQQAEQHPQKQQSQQQQPQTAKKAQHTDRQKQQQKAAYDQQLTPSHPSYPEEPVTSLKDWTVHEIVETVPLHKAVFHEAGVIDQPYVHGHRYIVSDPHLHYAIRPQRRFIMEEPMHEVGSHTFHGREAGYTYHVPYGDKTIHQAYGSTRDYADSKKFAPIHDFYVEPVMHQHDYDIDRSPTEGVATYDADHGHVKLIQEHDDRFAAFLQ